MSIAASRAAPATDGRAPERARDRTLMEIAYMGAFYGLADQARSIFAHFAPQPHPVRTREAAALGEALVCITERRHGEASALLETIIAQQGGACQEARALLALAGRLGGMGSARTDVMLEELAARAPPEVASFALELQGAG